MREPRARQLDAELIAVPRRAVDHRPARITKAQQPRHLVVRFARRIIACAADQPVVTRRSHEIQAGVASGNDEHDGGQRDGPVVEKDRLDVTGQVMDGDDRSAEHRGCRFGERHADEERPDETWPLRHSHSINRTPTGTRVRKRAVDHAADVAEVLP